MKMLTSAAIKAHARTSSASICAASRPPPIFRSCTSSTTGSLAGTPARWRTSTASADAARRRSQCAAFRANASSSPARIYNTDRPYSTECADPRRGTNGAIRVGRRLPRRHRRAPRGPARLDAASSRRAVRGARLRRHGPGAGARVRAARRPRLDWEEHLPHQRRSRVMDLPGEIICSLALEPDAPVARSVRHLHVVPARRAPPARLVAPGVLDSTPLHLVSDHRAARDAARRRSARRTSARTCTAAMSARRSARGTRGGW